jgi:hypothetical protein
MPGVERSLPPTVAANQETMPCPNRHPIDRNELGELFEALRDFADTLPDDPGNAHQRMFIVLVGDRGDALIGNDH